MATTKTNRQTKKNVEIDRRINEHREVIKQLRDKIKQLRDEIKVHLKAEEMLLEQKRQQKEKREMQEHPVVWDDYTPMIKLVFSWKKARFKKMILGWQKYSREEISPDETFHFDFNLVYQKNIISDLKSAMIKNDHLFNVSDRQLILYMLKHSNLGSFDAIKKAIQRQE